MRVGVSIGVSERGREREREKESDHEYVRDYGSMGVREYGTEYRIVGERERG